MAYDRSETRRALARGGALGTSVVLALALYAMVNYLSLRHYKRGDWTSSQIYSLSEKSSNILADLERDIDAVIFLSPSSEVYDAVDELLSRYEAANPQRFKKRVVDPARNLLEAQRLVETYRIDRENVVIIASGDDRRLLEEYELAEYDYSGAQFGQAPTLKGFKGEQLITSAILELVEDEKPKILFTSGHGEAPLERSATRSLSGAQDILGQDNFEIGTWASLGQSAVPADTDLLVIAGPTTSFLPPETELFSRYLDGGGRMLVLLDPVLDTDGGIKDVGLRDWLDHYGVQPDDDIVIDPASQLPFFGAETVFSAAYGNHPIVEPLAQSNVPVIFPLSRSLRRTADARGELTVSELVTTSDEGWGETNLAGLPDVGLDDDDIEGPVALGLAVSFSVADTDGQAATPMEEGGDVDDAGLADDGLGGDTLADDELGDDALGGDFNDDDFAMEDDLETVDLADENGEEKGEGEDEARLVVFGDLDFATDAQLRSGGNSMLVLNVFNWLVQRESLVAIESRRPEQTRLTLTDAELTSIFLLVLGIMPGCAIALGVWIYFKRRR